MNGCYTEGSLWTEGDLLIALVLKQKEAYVWGSVTLGAKMPGPSSDHVMKKVLTKR